MAEHGNDSGGGEVIDQPEVCRELMVVEEGDQQPEEAIADQGAAIESHNRGDKGQQKGIDGRDEHRATEEARAVEPIVRSLDPNMTVVGSVVSSGGSGNTGSSGDGCAPEAEPRATEEVGAARPSVEPVGVSTASGDALVVGGSFEIGGGSGAMGDDLGLIGSPPRDPARGKWAVVGGRRLRRLLLCIGRRTCCSGQRRHRRAIGRSQKKMSLST
ncbi:hypothetical protein RHMOL_Rhmol07G0203900 [Rhododendron molle]|uniref:Uncharacterized protein n=1 Tax=Rhododendron molle TaxID=49168 RepID=A0ACC0N4T3_RHOML|nr:hypothetical protein RHMOL_Rhmol07G0203900 [Rhododendron molle]